jgi:hypothetical protein
MCGFSAIPVPNPPTPASLEPHTFPIRTFTSAAHPNSAHTCDGVRAYPPIRAKFGACAGLLSARAFARATPDTPCAHDLDSFSCNGMLQGMSGPGSNDMLEPMRPKRGRLVEGPACRILPLSQSSAASPSQRAVQEIFCSTNTQPCRSVCRAKAGEFSWRFHVPNPLHPRENLHRAITHTPFTHLFTHTPFTHLFTHTHRFTHTPFTHPKDGRATPPHPENLRSPPGGRIGGVGEIFLGVWARPIGGV